MTNFNANDALQFGNTLRKYRSAKGLTQQDFADKCGITNSYLSRIECGERMPSANLINLFSEILDVPPYAILVASGVITERDARILAGHSDNVWLTTGDEMIKRLDNLEKKVADLVDKFQFLIEKEL